MIDSAGEGECFREIQGLYGPYTLSERVLQKLWLRQDFATDGLQTVSGQSLRIEHPGDWNHLGGSDFKNARIRINGRTFCADVEVHFTPEDWIAHGHEKNPAFNGVRLHVVLHKKPDSDVEVRTKAGHRPETVVLLPYLQSDLEAYATDVALVEMERICEHPDLPWFSDLPEEERIAVLREYAQSRWEQKLAFAKKRLEGGDWQEACHQYGLEVLGYARNREPMSRIALRYPLAAFVGLSADVLFNGPDLNWRLDGLRPANHPRLRLEQYIDLVSRRPDWPLALEEAFFKWPMPERMDSTHAFRKAIGLNGLWENLREAVLCGTIGPTRCNTLIADAFLPLAGMLGWLETESCFEYWWHGPTGDCPEVVKRLLRQSQVCHQRQVYCNGLYQGALGLFMTSS
ncbi:MAG: DUF2851 family protein [Coraliomargaritaceae bacterium]